jgi:hypothetical protein
MDNNFLMPEIGEEEDYMTVPQTSVEQESSVTIPQLPDMMMPEIEEEEEIQTFSPAQIQEEQETLAVPTPQTVTAELQETVDAAQPAMDDLDARIDQKFGEALSMRESQLDLDYMQAQLEVEQKEIDKQDKFLKGLAEARGISIEEVKQEIMEKSPESLVDLDAQERVMMTISSQLDKPEQQMETLKAKLKSENFITSGLTEKLLNSNLSLGAINTIVFADEVLNPATAIVNVPIYYRDAQEAIRNGDYAGAAGAIALGTLDSLAALPVAKLATTGVNKVWKTVSGGGEYSRVQTAMANESNIADQIAKANKIKANENKELRTQLIREFEERNNVTISVEDTTGNLKVDPQKVRATGKQKVTDYYYNDKYVGEDGKSLGLDDLAIGEDDLAIPILNPTKMDAFVGVVKDLVDRNPTALKTDKGERLVDRIFDLTLDKELLASEDLLNVLNKHGMSYEEYVLGIVGSGSSAGKLLNKIGQLKRIKPTSVKDQQAEKARLATQKALGKFWTNTVLRGENVRRGLMVSSLATAARNLQSGLIRSPMESLGDVMDTALISYAQAAQEGSKFKGIATAVNNINPLVRDGTWSGSFRNMRYILSDQNTAEQFTDYILDRPELADQFERMFNNIGEIQMLTGRGQATTKVGKGLDKAMSGVEDVVTFLNKPNLWQDHMIRRATFFSEMERLTKANYGIDLRKTLDEGRIKDLLNFVSIIDDAVKKSLDVTYASPPDFVPFKTMSDMITRSGLTVIVPFPRFMFKSIELMAQYSGGAGMLAIRKAISKESRAAGMVARDRQDISRNLVGLATMYAFYEYRKSNYSNADYTQMTYEDKQVDITAQYPLRQMSWIGEAAKRIEEGTLATWDGFRKNDVMETFLGSSARTGVGNVFIDEFAAAISDTDSIVDEEKRRRTLGRITGQFVNTYLTPIFQLSEAQRAIGIRTNEYKDTGVDPTLEGGFQAEFYRGPISRGLAAPSYEEELPARQTIDKGTMERPNAALKLFGGLSVREKDSDITDYLVEIGFGDPTFELGSKARVPSERRNENELISISLPLVVEIAKTMAQSEATSKKEEYTIARKYVNDGLRDLRSEYQMEGMSSALVQIVDQLNRVPKIDRSYALLQFKKITGRDPDVNSIADLTTLIDLSEDVYK